MGNLITTYLKVTLTLLVFITFNNNLIHAVESQEDSLLLQAEFQKDTARINVLSELCNYYRFNDLEKLQMTANLIVAESDDINFTKGLIIGHRMLGVYFQNQEDYPNAQFHFSEALKLAELSDSPVLMLKISVSLGSLYSRLNQYQEALRYYQKAAKYSEKVGIKKYSAIICNNQGQALANLERYEEAKTQYLKGISLTDTANSGFNYFNLLHNLGNAFLYLDKVDSAFYYNKIALNKYLETNDLHGVASSYFNKGIYHEDLKQYQKAMQAYEKGIAFTTDLNDLGLQHNLTSHKMLMFGTQGQIDSMITYFDISLELSRKLAEVSTDEAIHEISIKYEVEKTEQELQLTKHEKEKADLSVALKQNTIYTLMAVIFIILLVVVIFYILFREKQQIAQLEVESKNHQIERLIQEQEIKTYAAQIEGIKKERERVAQDLHDKIGGLLATIKLQFEGATKINEQSIDNIKLLVNESIKTVRSISHNLLDGRVDEMGLKHSIENLKKSLTESGNISFDLYLENYNNSGNIETEKELFKVVLELLGNTLKHAKASHIVLQINEINEVIHFTFEDNGVGFDPLQVKKGLGMRSITRRVESLNGTLSVDSKLGHGTTIIIEIPIS